jgi:C-terminal processing protease CtpA/Prc
MNYPQQILARVPPPQRKLIAALRALIRRSVPEAKETVLWDSLSYHRPEVGGRVKGAICLITPKPGAVHLGFIHGAALADPDHLLQGSRKSKRYIPIRRLGDIKLKSLTSLVRAAAKYQPGSASHVLPAALAFLLGFCLVPLRGAESTALKKDTASVLTRAQMESDLNYLTVRMKRAWAYAEDKRALLGVDVDALHGRAVRELDKVHDADGFNFLVKRYVGGLMDGHAGVRAGHSSPELATPRRWPFEVSRLDGRFYVKALDGPCGSLRPGDEVLSINGVSIDEKFTNALAISTGSTALGREYRAAGTMRYVADEHLHIEAARAGTNFTCAVEAPPDGPQAEEPIRWKLLDGNIGYLRFPSFTQDMKIWEAGGRGPGALQAALEAKKKALHQAFTELKGTPGLILDLRGNGGGSDALGHFLAHCLCDTQAHPIYYALWTRDSEDLRALPEFAYRTNMPASASEERSRIQLLPEKGVERYQGKLAVLMDAGCFSACDCFLNYLSIAAPKTIFVGRPNGAGAGAPRPVVTLPHSKMVITFCVMQVWNLNGQLIESRPIKPTVPVQLTAEDLRQGRDPDLEAAMRALRAKEDTKRNNS